MRVAGGRGDDIEDSIQSNIKEYAAKVKIYDEEEEGAGMHDSIKSKIKEYAEKVKPHHHGSEESKRVPAEL
jgi:hypothetical protein